MTTPALTPAQAQDVLDTVVAAAGGPGRHGTVMVAHVPGSRRRYVSLDDDIRDLAVMVTAREAAGGRWEVSAEWHPGDAVDGGWMPLPVADAAPLARLLTRR